MSETARGHYFVPDAAKWPFVGSIALTLMVSGFAAYLNGSESGLKFTAAGFRAFHCNVVRMVWYGDS